MTAPIYVVGLYKKELKIAKGDIRVPGDEVPEAVNWRQNVLNSHLSLKWLMTQAEFDAQKALDDIQKASLAKNKKVSKTPPKEAKPPKDPAKPKKLAETKTSDPLGDLDKKHLQALCRENKLSVAGNKEALKKRLRELSTE